MKKTNKLDLTKLKTFALQKTLVKQGMTAHTYHPSTWKVEARSEDHKFRASLGYITRPCLKRGKKRSY
jgi:hypothetical protein